MRLDLEGIVLAQPEDITPADGSIQLINQLSNPPLTPVTPETVHVRRCRLAGDAIDQRHGRFHTEDLPQLLSMCNGVSMLVGHNRSSLPIARLFGGDIEQENGISYICPKFYWMKGHSFAQDMAINIDGGIYNQLSISFSFAKPTCSECGKDIRYCLHVPGKSYKENTRCFVWYEELAGVHEGSIVFKGAQPGTQFNAERFWSDPSIWLQWGTPGIQPWEV